MPTPQPSITPQELRAILDVLGNAPITVVRATQLHPIIQKLILLASQERPIGAIEAADEAVVATVANDGPQEG